MNAVDPSDVATLSPGSEPAPGYRIIQLLSHGNDLDVYEAWSDGLQAGCILKMLREDRVGDEKLTDRLLREGELLTTLRHPHIVQGYRLLKEPQPMIAMEIVSGFTLAALLARRPRLTLRELAYLGEQVCSAVYYLHHHGVMHFDLKPANIIAHAGRAKIIDLSLAHAPGRGPAGWGTAAYMPPEQARGDEFSSACDVWAIGQIIYEAAGGLNPFHDARSGSSSGASPVDVWYPQLIRRAAPLNTLRKLPQSLREAIDACLEPEADQRPTVDELLVIFRSIQRSGRSRSEARRPNR